MVDHRKELSDEILTIDFYPTIRSWNVLLGICIGFLVAEPSFAFYYMLTLPLPALPISQNGFWISMAVIPVVGMVWGYIDALKYEGMSVRFNRDSITLYKDRIAKRQIVWSEVTSVKKNWNVMIEARQGPSIEIPLAVLNRGTFEALSLCNQLKKFNAPPKNLNSNKFMAWGAVLLVGGFALLISFPKPKDVFADADPGQFSIWLRILPPIFGSVAGIIGVCMLGLGFDLLVKRKKPHGYTVDDDGIRLREKQLCWGNLLEIQRSGSQDLLLKLVPRDGRPWNIDCNRFIDGESLRDSILSHAPSATTLAIEFSSSWSGEPIISKLSSGQWAAFAIAGLYSLSSLVVAVGFICFHWLGQRQNDPPLFGYFFAFCALFFASFILWGYRTVTLTQEGLTCKWLIGVVRKIQFNEIQLIEIKTVPSSNGTYDILDVRSGKAKIYVSSSESHYAELRDALLAIVPSDKVRMS